MVKSLLKKANLDPKDLKNYRPISNLLFLGKIIINFSTCVRNLGVLFDSSLSIKDQMSKVCPSAYNELHRISSIRVVGRYLTEDATKTLVVSFVLSLLD